MLGDKGQFKEFESLNGGSMTFGDWSTTTIEDKGSIDIHSSPTFHNVLFVNGLKNKDEWFKFAVF